MKVKLNVYLRSSAKSAGRCVCLQPFLAKAKVSQDDVALGVQKDVLRLEISEITHTHTQSQSVIML